MRFTLDEIFLPLPNALQITQPFTYLVYCWVGILIFSLILKFFGKGPNMKAGIVAALGILIMYVACVMIYRFAPDGLQKYVAPLPFVDLQEDSLTLKLYYIVEGKKVYFPHFCSQIASMFLLAFLVNQVYAFKHGNLKTPGWLMFRLFSTIVCIGVHYGAYRIMAKLLSLVPHESLLENALDYLPIGFLCVVLFLFVLGSLKKLMVHFFKLVNPTFEGLSGFFYANKFGTIVTRAIYTTLILTLFAYGLQSHWEEVYGVSSIPLTFFGNFNGIVTLVALFILWIILGPML